METDKILLSFWLLPWRKEETGAGVRCFSADFGRPAYPHNK